MTAVLVSRRPPRMTKRWEPKKWEPVYEQMVAMSCMGLSNVEIAGRFGYTPVHVSNVVSSEQGKRLKKLILDRLRMTVEATIPERLEDIAEKTVERLRTLVYDDDRFDKSPFAVIDRGIQVLKGLRHLKGDSEVVRSERTLVLTTEAAKLLQDGFEKSARADELHSDHE